jgi:exosortase family protein XrtF
MVGFYNYYLNKTQQKDLLFSCAPITKIVANQTASMIHFLGYKATIEQHQDELSLKVLVNNNYVSRIIEGCNSISVIILFLAFIIAFSGGLLQTVIFGIIGSFLIYLTNIFRIAILSIGILKYPKQQELLHSIVFPAIIYGMVFLLWIIWVNKFSLYKKKKNA